MSWYSLATSHPSVGDSSANDTARHPRVYQSICLSILLYHDIDWICRPLRPRLGVHYNSIITLVCPFASVLVCTGRYQRRTGSTRQPAESLPQQVPVLAPLVVRGEARRVRGLGDLPLSDLLQGVGALAIRTDGAHQMHVDVWWEGSGGEVWRGDVA